jgi:putative oxidoreductase
MPHLLRRAIVRHTSAMIAGRRERFGLLLLRVLVGGLMLFHGIDKIRHGIDGIIGLVERHGLPATFGYGVYVGEVIAPIAVLIGWQTRLGAAVIAVNMVVAVWLGHWDDILRLTRHGAWAIELQAFYLGGAIAIALLGAGTLSASRGRGRFD